MSDIQAGLLVPLLILIFIVATLGLIFYVDRFVRKLKENKSKVQNENDKKSSLNDD